MTIAGSGYSVLSVIKSEIRIPKYETNSKFKIRMTETKSTADAFSKFEIRICFVFRISRFEFVFHAPILFNNRGDSHPALGLVATPIRLSPLLRMPSRTLITTP